MMADMRLETIDCPMCGCKRFDVAATRVDGLAVVCCASCELAYLNPRPAADAIRRMYEEGYYQGDSEKHVGYSSYKPSAVAMKISRPNIWDLLAAETSLEDARALDVGCAYGHLVYWLEQAGAKATGIDISDEGVRYGRRKLGLDLRQTLLESLDEPDGTFDVITLIDVIEHVTDLNVFMDRLSALLKPAGVVFVQTPNFGTVQTWGERSTVLQFSLEHLLYFETHTLDRLFAKYGLSPDVTTRVLHTVPGDSADYAKMRKASKRSLRRLVGRAPGMDVVRLIRWKLKRPVRQAYAFDDTGRKGMAILGLYRKPIDR